MIFHLHHFITTRWKTTLEWQSIPSADSFIFSATLAGVLQAHFFDPSAPTYLNFAGLGYLYANVLSGVFDENGALSCSHRCDNFYHRVFGGNRFAVQRYRFSSRWSVDVGSNIIQDDNEPTEEALPAFCNSWRAATRYRRWIGAFWQHDGNISGLASMTRFLA